VPDLTGARDNIVATARGHSRGEADAAQAEVLTATTLIVSEATLEHSLSGDSPLVPVRDTGVVDSYIRVDFKARLSTPAHTGLADASFVLARKCVRTVSQQRSPVTTAGALARARSACPAKPAPTAARPV